MEDYPTEEEEFELMYNDEMELIDEIDENVNKELIKDHEPQPCCSKSIMNLSQHSSLDSPQSLIQSPQLSQISFGSAIAGPSGLNRRLFTSPGRKTKPISSTPIQKSKYPKKSLEPQILEIIDEQEEPILCPLDEIQNIGLTRKRRLADLFGDIRDIEQEEYVDKEAKKLKNDEERDLDLIEQILEARKKNRQAENPLKKDNLDRFNYLHEFKMRNLSYTIPNWPCIALVNNFDDRIYVRMHSESYETQHIDAINVFGKGYRGLLGESKDEIWNGAREIALKFLITPEVESDVMIVDNTLPARDEILWVEKYKPKKYIDLLSDETTNRSLLYWLKMWDKVVFGKAFNVNDSKNNNNNKLNSFNKTTGKFEINGGWVRRNKQNLNMDRDDYGRPMQKIALLSGPPGLGKTTQALTIAKHAGYNICEINASDDRSPAAFKLALENGTQMTSVLSQNHRPNCIVLDEIDGAPIQSIDFLIRFISDNYLSKPKKMGAKPTKNVLKRPIICICNDIYTPALRQLRQISFVVHFPPIESSRLAERLLQICRKEYLKCDLGTLLALAEKSGNDIRSCISMLQFYNTSKKQITLHDVLSSSLGQKDRYKNLFGVWTTIFQIQRRQLTTKTSNENSQMITMTNTSIATRAKNVLEVVHMGGDYERLMQGVYENYLNQKMTDPNLDGVVEATNWFCFSDLIQKYINSLQNYSVYPYLQFGFVAWHLLFAGYTWPKIQFPSKGFEVYQKTTTQNLIFQSLRRGISSGSIGIGDGKVILVETIPMLKKILSPHLRSVALQLLNTKERYDLKHTVSVMADLGLRLTQIKALDGTYQYTMEPDIDQLGKFNGFQGITLSYFGRQLIAREVELEQMRRATPKLVAKNTIKTNQISEQKSSKKIPSPQNVPNHLQNLKPKIRQDKNFKETICKDFFGRLSKKQTPLTTKEGGTDSIVKSPIWYKYKEGFNNAVRKDVIMSELL